MKALKAEESLRDFAEHWVSEETTNQLIAAVKSEAWDEAIDFVSRHYEDHLPINWQSKADEENPHRIEGEA